MSAEKDKPAEDGKRPSTGRTFLCVVDETEEMKVALRFACRRARHSGGHVTPTAGCLARSLVLTCPPPRTLAGLAGVRRQLSAWLRHASAAASV